MLYNIADTCISAAGRESVFGADGKKFICAETDAKPDCYINDSCFENLYYGVLFGDIGEYRYSLRSGNSVLNADEKWENAVVSGDSIQDKNALLLMFLYSYLSVRDSLLIHSSLIDYNGSGIMFTGPSGIGKTTQAELWNNYLNAEILNGDMVIVRMENDGFYGYGSPWHGSSPYCMNKKVKIKAIVTLSKENENSVERISGINMLRDVTDQVFLPQWYPEGMDNCFSTLDKLLTDLPVYHLACRADENAVLTLKNELCI